MARLAHWAKHAVLLAMALALVAGDAVAAVPENPHASAAEVSTAKRILEEDGFKDVTVISSDDQMVTVTAMKGGTKSVLDVDPLTGIVLPHADLPPISAKPAPVTGLPEKPR